MTLHLKETGEGSLYSCTLSSCNCDVLHRTLCADSDKIPEGGTSTYILHLSGAGAAEPEGAGELPPGLLRPDGGLPEGAPVQAGPSGRW